MKRLQIVHVNIYKPVNKNVMRGICCKNADDAHNSIIFVKNIHRRMLWNFI